MKRYLSIICLLFIFFVLSFSNISLIDNKVPDGEIGAVSGYWFDKYVVPYGAGTASSPYLITSPATMAWFNYNMNRGAHLASYYKLTANIDMGSSYWGLTTSYTYSFTGVFDGNGHTISNFINDSSYKPYLVHQNHGTIKNVKFLNSTLRGNSVAQICYSNYGTISNVWLKGLSVLSSNEFAGGISIYAYGGSISDCLVEGEVLCKYIGFSSSTSGNYSYLANGWAWSRAGPANWFTGEQNLYWFLVVRKKLVKTVNYTYTYNYSGGICYSSNSSTYVQRCIFKGSVRASYSDYQTHTYIYYGSNETTSEEYSCGGNAYDGLNDTRKPSSPSIGTTHSCGTHTSGSSTYTGGMTLNSSSSSNMITRQSAAICIGGSNKCYYICSQSVRGTGISVTSSAMQGWSSSTVSSNLGSAWARSDYINGGYPYLKYFYWQDNT